MITVNAVFGQEQKSLGTLGRVGENETRQIVFDCSDILAEYPGAEIVCVMQRHCDRIAYLADAVLDGNALTVTLTDADVSAPGDLRIELRALTDGKIRKSAVYMGQVVSALRGEQDKPGNPIADVLNRIDMTISRAEESIAEADAAAKSAQTVADIVQAKLDNGDFVGAKGDKGDPGKDASVTAESVKAALGYTPVKDVRLNGESLVQDSAATLPLAGYNRLGAVQLDPAGFAAASVEGKLALVPPTDAQISTHTHTQRPITPSCMDYAVKAAMCDGKGAAWTDAEQKAARERMGIDKPYELIEEITVDEDNVTLVERDLDITRMYIMIIGVSGHTGTCSLVSRFDTGDEFTAYWGLYQIAAQYEVVVEHGTANGYYKHSNKSISSTPTLMGINLKAMDEIFSATTKPSRITNLKISGPIPNGTKFKIYGVRA